MNSPFSIPKSVVTQLLIHAEQVLSLGFPCVDRAFSGFRKGDFAVFYGHPFCKTLSFLLSIRCQLPRVDGGLNSTTVYVDGGNTFNPYAVSAIAQNHGIAPQSALKKIFVSRAFTAYQLSSLIFETLEDAVKQYKSKLVLISDLTALFLDRDVPTKEAVDVFGKVTVYLSEFVKRRDVIIVASYFPHGRSRRCFFFESTLFGRTGTVIRMSEIDGQLLFSLEKHSVLKLFAVDVLPNAVALEKFVEA